MTAEEEKRALEAGSDLPLTPRQRAQTAAALAPMAGAESGGRRARVVQIRLSDAEHEALLAAAADAGLTVSEFLRSRVTPA